MKNYSQCLEIYWQIKSFLSYGCRPNLILLQAFYRLIFSKLLHLAITAVPGKFAKKQVSRHQYQQNQRHVCFTIIRAHQFAFKVLIPLTERFICAL